jgi:hypothetical protein
MSEFLLDMLEETWCGLREWSVVIWINTLCIAAVLGTVAVCTVLAVCGQMSWT